MNVKTKKKPVLPVLILAVAAVGLLLAFVLRPTPEQEAAQPTEPAQTVQTTAATEPTETTAPADPYFFAHTPPG